MDSIIMMNAHMPLVMEVVTALEWLLRVQDIIEKRWLSPNLALTAVTSYTQFRMVKLLKNRFAIIKGIRT